MVCFGLDFPHLFQLVSQIFDKVCTLVPKDFQLLMPKQHLDFWQADFQGTSTFAGVPDAEGLQAVVAEEQWTGL